MSKLGDQPGFAHAGFAHDGGDLAVAGGGEPKQAAEVLDFSVAADDAGESPNGCCLQACPSLPHPGEHVRLDGVGQALDWNRPDRPNRHEAFGHPERIRRDQD